MKISIGGLVVENKPKKHFRGVLNTFFNIRFIINNYIISLKEI